MPDNADISIINVATRIGRTRDFRLLVNGQEITVPVDEALFAHYTNQFSRKQPSERQQQRYSTLYNLMRAAYKKGVADGKKTNERV
jgi:hypothetical protein